MNIILADEQKDVRSALKLLLEHEAGLSVEREAGNSADLMALIRSDCPDILLYDWDLPGSNGSDIIETLKEQYRDLTIIVLSSNPENRSVAIDAGADGFISKGSSPLEVITVLTRYIIDSQAY